MNKFDSVCTPGSNSLSHIHGWYSVPCASIVGRAYVFALLTSVWRLSSSFSIPVHRAVQVSATRLEELETEMEQTRRLVIQPFRECLPFLPTAWHNSLYLSCVAISTTHLNSCILTLLWTMHASQVLCSADATRYINTWILCRKL